jgi:holin-like protein
VIKGLFILLSCQLLGEFIHISADLPMPGAVIGMVLLLLLLLARKSIVETVEPSSQKLISLLPLLFMPPTVGIAFLGADFNDQWPAFAAAAILGTVFTLCFCALLLKRLLVSSNKGGAGQVQN